MKPSICIITDNLIQYPSIRFPGQHRIRLSPLTISYQGAFVSDTSEIKPQDLPETVDRITGPQLRPPDSETQKKFITSLLEQYDEIIAIFSSSSLTSMYTTFLEASVKIDRQSRVQMIDSQTLSLGQGYLVKMAAQLAENDIPSREIVQALYAKIPHIYTLFNIPSLSYLYQNQLLDISQAYVGEKLGLMPNFAIEDGQFISTDKMRNKRHITDCFLEYIREFESIEYVAFVYGYTIYSATAKLIRDSLKEAYRNVDFSEHKISLPISMLFGPTCQGLIVIDNE
ncbi:MAG: DegV family EDD domain-containing protein [Anaerolineae bacterium]|nr:DegV family EDD domain-containing protein [Anaerolineae bacterium]